MRIYPAIDIKDGKCVRLLQGKFDKTTVFNDQPEVVAKEWAAKGASYIHVVDLDGARYGSAYNDELIEKIVKAAGVPVQTGGGIRSMRDIEDKLNIGVSRVILGTAAVSDHAFVKNAVQNYGDRIAVGIDAVNGMAAIKGWEEVSSVAALDLCLQMRKMGVKTIIYTDITKDGMMAGPNLDATREISDISGMNVIASGGVSSMSDLEKLNGIGVSGVIIGRALYQGALDLRNVINVFERE